MDIKISYSKIQLDCAIEFITQSSESMFGKEEETRTLIQEMMIGLSKDLDTTHMSMCGITLIADWQPESLYSDENICRIDILIDPAFDLYDEVDQSDIQEFVVFKEDN